MKANMKNIYGFLIILCCAFNTYGQSKKEKLFQATIKEVISALSTRDSLGLSKFESDYYFVFILFAEDTTMMYRREGNIGFTDTSFPYAPFYDQVKYSTSRYTRLPEYSCTNFTWTKTGIFVDTNRVDHYLSYVLNKMSEGQQVKMIKLLFDLENRSRRIVVSDNKYNSLIFYLSYIDDKWYLTMIDKYSLACIK